MPQLPTPPQPVGFFTPEQFGAKGDNVTDDLPAFTLMITTALAAGGYSKIRFGTRKSYVISKAVQIENAVGISIDMNESEIIFPSDDPGIAQVDTEHTRQNLRSAFYVRNVQHFSCFNGRGRGTGTNIIVAGGSGNMFYLRRCVSSLIQNCQHQDGGSLIQEDVVDDTISGSGNKTIVLSGSTVTFTDASTNLFHGGMVGQRIFVSGSANPQNDGNYLVTGVTSTSVLQYTNANAVNETTALRWTVRDGHRATRVVACKSRNPRSYCAPSTDTTYIDCHFEWPTLTADHCGIPRSFSLNGTTVTLTDPAGRFKPVHHGKYVKIAGATSSGNNIAFALITYISSTQISYTNGAGVTELAPNTSSWWVINGDKVGVGAGTGSIALSKTTTSIQVTASTATFHRTSGSWITDGFVAGGVITTTGFVNGGNNTTKIISTITATDIVATTTTGLVDETATATAWNNLITFTSASATFNSGDVGAALRLVGTANSNDGAFTIEQIVSTTQVLAHNANGAAENFAGVFTINSYDNTTDSSSNTNGSTHGVYIFGGRRNVKFKGCTWRGTRTCALKVSGTNGAIEDIQAIGCSFYETANAVIFGADDVNEHNGLLLNGCYFEDCATQRAGWGQGGNAVGILGSRGVQIAGGCTVHYTRNAIGSVDGNGVANNAFFSASRYALGASQPLEDVLVDTLKLTRDTAASTNGNIMPTAMVITAVGQRAKYGTGASLVKQSTTATMTIAASAGTLTRSSGSWTSDGYAIGQTVTMSGWTNGGNNTTKTILSLTATVLTFSDNTGLVNEGPLSRTATNNVITLTDAGAFFSSSQDVGKSITLVNAVTGGNNGTFTILSATKTTLTWTNASGATGGAGTYRLPPRTSAGQCKVTNCQFLDISTTGIISTQNTGVEYLNNSFSGTQNAYRFIGDDNPKWSLHVISANTLQALVRYDNGTSWPIATSATTGNQASGLSFNRDVGVGVGNSTRVDYPLQGTFGRVLPSGGFEEITFAYGAGHVDGDTVVLSGAFTATFTYKSASPGANQFNSLASLLALFNGVANLSAADYGTGYASGAVTTQHVRVRRTAGTTTDGNFKITCTALNPTALVSLRNDNSPNSASVSRGSASTGPTADKLVIYSPCCSLSGVTIVVPDTVSARTSLAGGPALPLKNVNDAGCCEVVQVNATDGTEEYRWRVT